MFKQLITFSCLSFIVFASCQKNMAGRENVTDAATEKTIQEDVSVNSIVSQEHWYGNYKDLTYTDHGDDPPGADPDINYVSDVKLIKNGVAKITNPGPNYTFTYSNIIFDIPTQYVISGDSLTFQTVVENPSSSGFYDQDIILQITGSQQSAKLHFVADVSKQLYDEYYIGNIGYNNLSQLVHYFGTFQTIKWVIKKNGTAAYINGKLAYKFNYGTINRIGTVKTISIAGEGYVTVNSVTLLNSYTNKKIMVENFNVDGQSHTIFY